MLFDKVFQLTFVSGFFKVGHSSFLKELLAFQAIIALLLITSLIPNASAIENNKQPVNQIDSSDTQNNANDACDKTNNEITVSTPFISKLEGKLDAIATNLAPNKNREAAQDKNEQEALNIGKQDLVYQKLMAWGTMVMATLALAGIALNIVGIIVLIKTLRHTKEAAVSTARALDITREQLRQNRAYMVFDIDSGSYEHELKEEIRFQCKWINCGGSPAIDVSAFCVARIIDETDREKISADILNQSLMEDALERVSEHQTRANIGQGQKYTTIRFRSDDVRFIEVSRFNYPFAFHACCVYSDIHGRRYTNKFTAFGFGKKVAGKGSIKRVYQIMFEPAMGYQNGETEITDNEPKK